MEIELSRLVDALPGLVWTTTPFEKSDFVNQRLREYSGLTLEQVRESGWRTTIHPDDLDRAQAIWDECIASGEPGEVDARLRRADGVYRRFNIKTCPVRDADGRIVGWCGVNTDIEDRLLAEEALREHQVAAERAQARVALTASEEELRRTNQYLALAQQLSQTGSYARDVETDQQTLSDEMYRLWEFDPAKPVTHAMVLDRIHPDDLAQFQATQSAALAAGADFTMTFRMVMPDGRIKHLRTFSQRQAGIPERLVYVGATQDVTEWKLAEAALKTNEAELLRANSEVLSAYRHLAEAQRLSLTGSFTLDFRKNELFWSDELYRIFEWEPCSPVTLERVRGLVHPEDVPTWAETIERAAAGYDIDLDYRIVAASGSLKHLRAVGHRVEYSAERPVFIGAVQDVTAAKLAELALSQSERESRLVVDSIPGMVAVFSAAGELEAVNNQVLEYFGASLEELKDWTGGGFTHPEDSPRAVEAFSRSIATGEAFEIEIRARRNDGSYRWFKSRGLSLLDAGGRIARWYNLLVDIDDEKRTEEALNRARSELAHVARAATLSALTASIAHEVNQPLASLVANAGTCVRALAANPPNLEVAQTTAQRTIRDANRASDVIQRLRAMFARKAPVNEPVELNEAAKEVLVLTAAELQSAGVVLRTEFGEGLPPVSGDRIQLQQVILNLVLNAADAMRAIDGRPRHLSLSTSLDLAKEIRLSVRDEGTGIDPAALDRLFDAFYTTKSKGMGIGLSISRSIIRAHDGRLWAANNSPGPGATFSFSIPCGDAAPNSTNSKDVYR